MKLLDTKEALIAHMLAKHDFSIEELADRDEAFLWRLHDRDHDAAARYAGSSPFSGAL